MGGFLRRIKRRQFVTARKKFMKDFKSSMRNFKKQVICVKCNRGPREGEKIDDWHIDKYSNNIDLICTDCYTVKESEETNENSTEL
tara:strand:- start:1965 stop:2222 length:258 start_codon:yes stop_codon:yes gene_type:complete